MRSPSVIGPSLYGCAKRHCPRWHNARWRNASWGITPELSRRHTARPQERICRTELPPIRGDREVPSVIGGIQHRNRQSATRTSSDCSPIRLPGINIGAAAYIPPRGIRYGSGKGFGQLFPRAVQDRAVADSCPLKRHERADRFPVALILCLNPIIYCRGSILDDTDLQPLRAPRQRRRDRRPAQAESLACSKA